MPRQWTKLLALCQKVIIFHFTVFSFRAQHSTIFPSVLLTYTNKYVKANFNYLLYNWNDTQNDGNTISVKSRENLQQYVTYLFLCSVTYWGDALILKDEHKPTILKIQLWATTFSAPECFCSVNRLFYCYNSIFFLEALSCSVLRLNTFIRAV